MDPVNILLGILLVVATVLCCFAIWALTQVVSTARSVKTLADDMDVRLVPLLDKADVTVDALNAELLRVDGIVGQFEQIGDRVSGASRAVQEVTSAPGEIVGEIADRVRHAWRSRKSRP
ncbi:MAG: hypothetical protein HGA39_06860 [Coriobacteriia bacterium]|nr:hypothetical protein [Coriobacteriia bacterium]